MGKKYDSENIGLCRDDVWNLFENTSGPYLEKKKNTFRKYSKKMLNVFVEYKFSRCYL